MKKLFLALMATLIATAALAQSAPAPALTAINKASTPPSTWLNGYPYGSSGLYVGLFTEGGGGSVTANIPGIASASLTTTTASIGATVGYAWGSKSSSFAYAIEGSICATNFNGANAGFALAGPLCFEQMGLIWMPVSLIQTTFSLLNLPNPFNSIAPFPVNPAGISASNVQAGFGVGAVERDMTLAYLGVGSNKVYSVAPQIEFALMEQLSNGSALQEYLKVRFPSHELLFGATQSTATPSTEVIAGIKVLF